MEIHINDVRIRLSTCDHCKIEPSEADAMRAIAEYKEKRGNRTCSCCGKPIEPTRFLIVHQVSDGEVNWIAKTEPDPPDDVYIRPSGWSPTRFGFIHRECARKALPFLPPEVLETAEERAKLKEEHLTRFIHALNEAENLRAHPGR